MIDNPYKVYVWNVGDGVTIGFLDNFFPTQQPSDEPTEQNEPVGQVTQSSRPRITAREVFWCVPPGHGCGALEPSTHR